MAIQYVDSNAVGANDGTSFTDAFTSITSWVEPGSGSRDFVYVASDHSETFTGGDFPVNNASMTDKGRIFAVSVNSTTEVYERSATFTFTTSTVNMPQNWEFHGFDMDINVECSGDAQPGKTIYKDCAFDLITSSSNFEIDDPNEWFEFIDCSFHRRTVGEFFPDVKGLVKCRSCVFTEQGSISVEIVDFGFGDPGKVFFEDCDFSDLDADEIFVGTTVASFASVVRCRLPAGIDIINFTSSARANMNQIEVHACDDGTFTNPVVRVERYDKAGDTKTTEAIYRDDGASDGSTNYSWAVTGLDDSTSKAFQGTTTPWISVWVDGGSAITATIELAHDAVGDGTAGALETDQIWLELQGPDDTSPATAQGYWFSGRPDLGDTATDVTTSTEAWTGSGVGTKQKLAHTYTPDIGGYVSCRVHFAPGSTTGDVLIHVDPKIEVT